MKSNEFEQQYAERSGVTVEWLRANGLVVVKCVCDSDMCEGWALLPGDIAEDYINDMPGLYGYRYPMEGE